MADVNRLRTAPLVLVTRPCRADRHVGLSSRWFRHIGRRAAGVVETRRNGRETVCRLRGEAFDEFAARERAVLGFAG
jgi:hypothetical protein